MKPEDFRAGMTVRVVSLNGKGVTPYRYQFTIGKTYQLSYNYGIYENSVVIQEGDDSRGVRILLEDIEPVQPTPDAVANHRPRRNTLHHYLIGAVVGVALYGGYRQLPPVTYREEIVRNPTDVKQQSCSIYFKYIDDHKEIHDERWTTMTPWRIHWYRDSQSGTYIKGRYSNYYLGYNRIEVHVPDAAP